jgi:putative FmdB family regulatory protein
MPLYDFHCEPCDLYFEVSRSFKDSEVPAFCPTCDRKAKREMSVPMATFTRGAAAEGLSASLNGGGASAGARWSHGGHSHGPGAGGHSH